MSIRQQYEDYRQRREALANSRMGHYWLDQESR